MTGNVSCRRRSPLEWKFRFEGLDRERVPAELQHTAR